MTGYNDMPMPWCDVCHCYHHTRTAVCQPPRVAPFVPRAVESLDEPIPEVIAYLEKLLVKAKTGEMRGIAVAVVYRADGMGNGWSGATDASRLKGEIAQLLHDFCAAHGSERS